MKVVFSVHFNTQWGDQVGVVGNIDVLGNNNVEQAFSLSYKVSGYWEGQLQLPANSFVRYKYVLKAPNGLVVIEPRERTLFVTGNKPAILLNDQWYSPEETETILYKSVFENAIFKRAYPIDTKSVGKLADGLNFAMSVPRVKKGYKVCVSGNVEALGNWNKFRPLLLESPEFALWKGGISVGESRYIEYKYGIYSEEEKCIVEWETGENRRVKVDATVVNVCGDACFRFANAWKGAGIAIPVFSIRTNKSLGIGEFSDLILFGQWVQKMGMNMVQILPVNDTIATSTWTDSYPYNAISVNALNPLYLRLDSLFQHDQPVLNQLAEHRKRLNALDKVDFEEVLKIKFDYLHRVFDYHKNSLSGDEGFQRFFNDNSSWLKPYALFCHLRDVYNTTDFSRWEDFSVYKTEVTESYFTSGSKYFNNVMFYCFMQYHLHLQFSSAIECLHDMGIALKGDIPIGINRESVDAWATSDWFHFDQQAGAPPDYFSTLGQNWGFPTYNWKKMRNDDFSWWKNRFVKMADYFDAYRIDHILGFFRIWEIPFRYTEGLMGHFNPALPYSTDEIRANGIPFDPLWYCTPHLFFDEAKDYFAGHTTAILNHFFRQWGDVFYLKEEFSGTRSLPDELSRLGISDQNITDSLRQVFCDVLFIEDENEKGFYHPRIELQRTRKFAAMDEWVQYKVMNLYNHYFFSRHNDFWKEQAMKKLPKLIEATNMLVCGEDLGMIPACVPEVMSRLKILTLDIETFSKHPDFEFSDPHYNGYYSVCTTSTHDTPTMRGMWKENPDKGRRMVQTILHQDFDGVDDIPAWLCRNIIKANLSAGSVFTILPFQDWLAMDETIRNSDIDAERINRPEFSRYYWRYRMHIPVEELLQKEYFNTEVLKLIAESGR